VAIGTLAGMNQTDGSNNVYIGAGMSGIAGESAACYIGSIYGQTSASGIPVLINSDNKLGTTTSSKRFKDDIKPMDKASEALFELKPVTFHYKKELDSAGIQQFGLVAEEVQKVNSALIMLDKEGKPYSVRYDQVNAMLLNEFLKEHKAFLEEQRKVQKQEATTTELKTTVAQQKNDFQATVAQLTARLDEQASQIQKVSAQLEASKSAPQVVNNP
jgi:Chaperone of endosialidase